MSHQLGDQSWQPGSAPEDGVASLQRLVYEAKKRASQALSKQVSKLETDDRQIIQELGVALVELGQAQAGTTAAATLQEAYELFYRIGDPRNAGTTAYSLANLYLRDPSVQDLRIAERWYLRGAEHSHGVSWNVEAKCLGQLGVIYAELALEVKERYERRSWPVRKVTRRAVALRRRELLRRAHEYVNAALRIIPNSAINELAVSYNQLGHILVGLREYAAAVDHFIQASYYDENRSAYTFAGDDQFEAARLLVRLGKMQEGLEYARRSLKNYEAAGKQGTEMVERAKELVWQLGGASKSPPEIHIIDLTDEEV